MTVGEKAGRAMTYTLAVVDEGLLGLTRYAAPDLRKRFYNREALGVLTWDLFDDVAEAYGADLSRLLALGGDEEGAGAGAEKKQRRFPPVVLFAGPFSLDCRQDGGAQVQDAAIRRCGAGHGRGRPRRRLRRRREDRCRCART